MRVAHGNAGHVVDLFIHNDGCADDILAVHINGNLPRSKNGCTHVHAGGLHFAVLDGQLKRFYAGKRVNGDGGAAIGHVVVVQVLAHAADAVAAHFSLRAIGVEDTHLRIRLVGRRNKDNAVAADTEVRFTELDRKRLGIGHSLVEAIKIDIIVAAAVHLGESQLHTDSLLRK